MRELNFEEQQAIQGGFIITATVLTLIGSGVVAALYLTNSLTDIFIYDKTGTMPAQPTSTETNQIGNDISTLSTVIKDIPK